MACNRAPWLPPPERGQRGALRWKPSRGPWSCCAASFDAPCVRFAQLLLLEHQGIEHVFADVFEDTVENGARPPRRTVALLRIREVHRRGPGVFVGGHGAQDWKACVDFSRDPHLRKLRTGSGTNSTGLDRKPVEVAPLWERGAESGVNQPAAAGACRLFR